MDIKLYQENFNLKDAHDKQSLLARKYIKYWANKHQLTVQFCESELGEYLYKGKYR